MIEFKYRDIIIYILRYYVRILNAFNKMIYKVGNHLYLLNKVYFIIDCI